MDLAVPTGTPIRAALPGTVTVSADNQGGYGYYIMIDHGNGLSTRYVHCSQLLASVGRTVEADDVIALSGSTERSIGPHLHFKVRVNGERVTPAAICRKAGKETAMEKSEITVAFDHTRLEALEFYLKKVNSSVQERMDEVLR